MILAMLEAAWSRDTDDTRNDGSPLDMYHGDIGKPLEMCAAVMLEICCRSLHLFFFFFLIHVFDFKNGEQAARKRKRKEMEVEEEVTDKKIFLTRVYHSKLMHIYMKFED